MQEQELENKRHGSHFAGKSAQLDPSFSLDMLKQQQSDNVSIYELDQSPLIERIKHLLASEIFNPNTGTWEKEEDIEPLMNSKGVHYFMVKFGGHLDKNITLSKLDISKIHQMMVEICNDILEIFWKKDKIFDIKRENMSSILHIVEHHIYANYMRALDGGERTHRETLIKSVESIIDRQDSPKQSSGGGMLGMLNPFKRKQPQAIGGNNYG